MIVFIQGIEEAFLDVNLPGDKELAMLQAGTDLLLDFIERQEGAVGKDRFAVLFVVAGVTVQIFEAHIRIRAGPVRVIFRNADLITTAHELGLQPFEAIQGRPAKGSGASDAGRWVMMG
jgi:hypothetical protein